MSVAELIESFSKNGEDLAIESEIPIVASYVQSPNEFYIQRPEAYRSISLLQIYIRQCKNLRFQSPPARVHVNGTYLYVKGDLQSQNRQFYRIKIQHERSNSYDGILLDTGESPIPVHKDNLIFCPTEIRSLKPLAFKCSLFDISLSEGKWEEVLYNALRSFLLSPETKFRVKVLLNAKGLLHVLLYDQLGSVSKLFFDSKDPKIISYVTKKVPFSKIPYQTLPRGEKLLGNVVASGPELIFFWVSSSDWGNYQEGIKTIQGIYDGKPKLRVSKASVQVESSKQESFLVIAKSNSKWRRCMIGGGTWEDGFELYDVDSGEALSGVKDLYKVTRTVAQLPCYVHSCRLVGYNGHDEDDCFLGQTLINFEDNVDFIVKDVDPESKIHHVDIYP